MNFARTGNVSQTLKRASRLIGAVALTAVCGFAAAAEYPTKPITLVAPFPPGGSTDIVARNLAPMLAERLGQTVVVENVSGAGGVLGTQRVVRSDADGYMILLGSGSEVLINPLINPNVTYDGRRDLAPVVFVGTSPMVLIGKPQLQVDDISNLLALARSKPDQLTYASAGNGTPMHLAGELLKMKAGLKITHVPYRGTPPALNDLLGGRVDLAISTLTAAQSQIQAGKVKAFAVTSVKPSPLAPTIPALGELPNLEGIDIGVWFGLFMPAKTPADIVRKVEAAAQQVLADGELRKRLMSNGVVVSGASAENLRRFMVAEEAKYRDVVKTANISSTQ